ncbi:MAG: Crp/Fnr family transcriptional regulator [Litorimonas sp.]
MTSTFASMHHDPALSRLPQSLVDAFHLTERQRNPIGRGRSIIASGQPVSSVFLISEGWAVSRLSIDTDDTQILDILGPGSFAGLDHLDELGDDDYAAIALQDVLAYRFDAEKLQDVCSKSPELSQWLSEELSHQTQRAQRHLAALGQLPARGRLAFAMIRIFDVAQQTGESVTGKTIRLPMTQEEIGNMLGLTNVSISKLMSAFRKEGLIDYGRNRIVLHDLEALSEICGMSPETVRAPSGAKAEPSVSESYAAAHGR